jgi:Uma2 family endonuclease
MRHDTLAPWAEPVPDAGPMTADDLLRLDDTAWQFELVEGRLIRMAPTGLEHLDVTRKLYRSLDRYVDAHDLGIVTLPDTGFRLTRPGAAETVLSPDIAYVSAARVRQLPPPGTPERKKFLPVAPDLAVEVASPDQHHPEMADKARLYLASGVRLVWLVWPSHQQVDIWRPGTDQPTATLGPPDTLDGLDVLPGFTYPVADLFS